MVQKQKDAPPHALPPPPPTLSSTHHRRLDRLQAASFSKHRIRHRPTLWLGKKGKKTKFFVSLPKKPIFWGCKIVVFY